MVVFLTADEASMGTGDDGWALRIPLEQYMSVVLQRGSQLMYMFWFWFMFLCLLPCFSVRCTFMIQY